MSEAVAQVYTAEWSRIVASLIRFTGDWDLAEECAQDAFAQALTSWPTDGIPQRPGAWVTTTARNRALDRLRRAGVEAAKLRGLALVADRAPEQPPPGGDIPDERLELIFTCCHPALAVPEQVALTLRYLCGLRTAEIARALLLPEKTLAQRLTRAKSRIRGAGIPFRVPPGHALVERTPAVLAVLYLIFNEGYATTRGPDPVRPDLGAEAIRLARLTAGLMPDEPEALGLLALMLLHDARREARFDPAGDLVTLPDQDRSRFDAEQIAEGLTLLDRALRRRRPGPYQVQAAIAACHASASDADSTDWPQIALLYEQLTRIAGTPVVELNRAVAVSMADGPEAGLALVEALVATGTLSGYHLLAATRADLLRRLGRMQEALACYAEALDLATAEADRRFLVRRMAEVAG
ncbi:RNA polymerase sigma-70 factor (ECF subfamily) [Allocatelliglobosispora scoriae]|uniref:RNA polymerase sigma-70 factor (ECF subfamily) n=1 Tax=Allocatelliglobosispora scoriae TaxID=643052 RepID=A0A841C096_9ACTN|nr:RNA polymerase sigma-70 factor (ECF subfamily) [Allocatelliglobosispora scoriae]